jgi:hypothetical protein
VALFNIKREEVARGVVHKLGVSSILGGCPIQVMNKIVLVQSIKDEMAHVYELYMSTIEDRMD